MSEKTKKLFKLIYKKKYLSQSERFNKHEINDEIN